MSMHVGDSNLREAHLEDVDGGLVDGADNGAAGVDCVAYGAHHDSSRARVQTCIDVHTR